MERLLCKVCSHTQISEINEDLLKNRSLRWISDKYPTVTKSTLQRHKAYCMAKDFALAKEIATRDLDAAIASEREAETRALNEVTSKVLSGVMIAEKLNETMGHAEDIRSAAMDDEDYLLAIKALDLTIKGVREYTKLAGEAREQERLREDHLKSDWARIRLVLNQVLDKHPEVKEELNAKLSSVGSPIFT